MSDGAKVLSQPLGGSALALAVQADVTPAGWYAPRPRGPAEWRAHAETVRGSVGTDWLNALHDALFDERSVPTSPAYRRLAASGIGRGIVITTGQQPGLFGGPIYTWSKALSALALADEIEAASGVPAAPVFWAATDDADFTEASVTHIAVPGGVETLALSTHGVRMGASMSDVPLREAGALLRRLERAAGSATYPRALSVVREAYEDGATIGSAYVALLRALLEPLGIAVLDASHRSVRAAARPMMVRALTEAARVEEALLSRDEALRVAGYEPQVALVAGLSLVFRAGKGIGARERVPIGEAAKWAAQAEVADLGPNVLLRPIVERSILPVAGYVAGPAELAYFAQVGAVAVALGAPVPTSLPRWSSLIVEPHVQRILDRYSLSADDLRDPHAAEARLARETIPRAGEEALRAARDAAAERVEALRGALATPPEGLLSPPVLDGLARDLQFRLDRLERRVVAAAKRKHSQVMRDVATARGALFPAGKPQERALNFLPLLARNGPTLLDTMLARAREHATSLVTLGSGAPIGSDQ